MIFLLFLCSFLLIKSAQSSLEGKECYGAKVLRIVKDLTLAHLLVKVPLLRDSKMTFWSLSQAATCYYQFNHSKVKTILLSALPKNITTKLLT